MNKNAFNTNLRDSQTTVTHMVSPKEFDFTGYVEYEQSMLEKNRMFKDSSYGLLVYRRFRPDGVFYEKSRNFNESLSLQLGALASSMAYKADIANFLEPWYGIGYIASCYGKEYIWSERQAPQVRTVFQSCEDMLKYDPLPIVKTKAGKRILEMIEYFLEKTKGKLPVSLTDVQSPLNMLSHLIPIDNLFIEIIQNPTSVKKAANIVSNLLVDFIVIQKDMIGDCLASPGHGFASSRAFSGVGFSNDLSTMLSAEQYQEIFMPFDNKIGAHFSGLAYHSCGDWSAKIDMVKSYDNLIMVDGAFSAETDPMPNNPRLFAEAFADSGISLNARVVGNYDLSYNIFQTLWQQKQKLICVSYCQTVEEQERLYNDLHALAKG